jgi:adenylyltransferase/sulfurtransferase
MNERYVRQMLVDEFAESGQKKIANASVLIAGAGGLATPAASYLVAAGIGSLGIVDGDNVQTSNLHRQFAYTPEDIGKSKATLLAEKLSGQNPECKVTAYDFFLTPENTQEVVEKYDLVCDCTDNAISRILIDNTCKKIGKPLIFAAVNGWEGYITVLHHKNKISLSHIFAHDILKNNATVTGIINTTCGIAGSMQATEALKIILDLEIDLDGNILCFNSLHHIYRKFKIKMV